MRRAEAQGSRRYTPPVATNNRDAGIEVAGGAARLLDLQQTAGNRAVTSLLSGRSASTIVSTIVQRHPGKKGLPEGHQATDHELDEREAHDAAVTPAASGQDKKSSGTASGAVDADIKRESAPSKVESKAPPTQSDFDAMDSPALIEYLTSRGGARRTSDTVYRVDLQCLPPQLQALIRYFTVTLEQGNDELRAADAKDRALETTKSKEKGEAPEKQWARVTAVLRGRVRAAARSWHDDDRRMLPRLGSSKSPIARFFAEWRKQDVEEGVDVPAKQRNKESRSDKYPFREYTALGWKEGFTLGRLIFDGLTGIFYLTAQHYQDKFYFQVEMPKAPAVEMAASASPALPSLTDYDLDFVMFQAWAEVAAELDLAVHAAARQQGGDEEEPNTTPAEEKLVETYGGLDPVVQECLAELADVRTRYQAAYQFAQTAAANSEAKESSAEALKTKIASKTGKAADKKEQERLAKKKEREKRQGRAPATSAKVKQAEDEEGPRVTDETGLGDTSGQVFATFMWCGYPFRVGSEKGYIGYRIPAGADKGKVKCPSYDSTTTVGTLAALYTQCVATRQIAEGDLEQASLMLAALIAESSRHQPATLEALFSVIHDSPFGANTQAYGVAFRMAAGGTIATGGVSQNVVLQEAAHSRRAIASMLAKYQKLSLEEAQQKLTNLAKKSRADALSAVKSSLFAILRGTDAQTKQFSPPRARTSPTRAAPQLNPTSPPPASAAPIRPVVVSEVPADDEKNLVGLKQ